MITVTIPIGPKPSHIQWLRECVESVVAQTFLPSEILFILDYPVSEETRELVTQLRQEHSIISIYEAPWRLGVSSAFNFGVALAKNEMVFLLGADDTLEPECLAQCVRACQGRIGYYFVSLTYMDTGEIQALPCNAAMVTKELWKLTGGFPIETASGAGDVALISILTVHHSGMIKAVALGTPLYNYRRHPMTETAQRGAWHNINLQICDRLIQDYSL